LLSILDRVHDQALYIGYAAYLRLVLGLIGAEKPRGIVTKAVVRVLSIFNKKTSEIERIPLPASDR
jgi:hypothetical protein